MVVVKQKPTQLSTRGLVPVLFLDRIAALAISIYGQVAELAKSFHGQVVRT